LRGLDSERTGDFFCATFMVFNILKDFTFKR
jgi:hypothetical protein